MDIIETVNKKFDGNKRLKHIYGVADLAKSIAEKYNVNPEKAYVAGILHDFCKYDDIDFMTSLMNKEDVIKFKDAKEIYHAYASSEYAKRYLGIDDVDILNAIKYHVYGRINMSNLEKIIVVCDFCEPNRDFPEATIVRNNLDNLDYALYLTLDYSVNFLYKKNVKPLDEELEVLNYYKEVYYGTIKKNN